MHKQATIKTIIAALFIAVLIHCPAIAEPPNLIFITMDDMSCDSVGVYGSAVPNITPHIDRLAFEGMRFDHAYVAASSCAPSRNAFMTGRHSNVNGVMGFYSVESGHYQTLPEVLRANRYYTGVIHKPRDTSLNNDYDDFWDYHTTIPEKKKRNPPEVGQAVSTFLAQAKAHNGPFFCVINIADPHQPFHGDPNQDKGGSHIAPSKIYKIDDVEVPAFLPDFLKIKQEVLNYTNSVKRGDDCVGAVVETLKREGVYENSVIMFVSDHGMPLPYAKGSLYRAGLRTPWIVRWPSKIKAGQVDRMHMISAVDLMPTLLDIAGVNIPEGVQGQSFLPLIEGEKQADRDHVFAQYNENAGGLLFPMRSVQTKRFNYIFNPWSDGETEFITASNWTPTYGKMKSLSKTNEEVAKRFEQWTHRSVEELYDYGKDPHGLNNVINDPAYAKIVIEMRAELAAWMKDSNDYALEAFNKKQDAEFLKTWMARQDAEALKRAKTLEWKRYRNRTGGTGKRIDRYVPPTAAE